MLFERYKSLLLVLSILFSYVLVPEAAVCCTIYAPPPTKFDSLEYVFIGRVIDVIGPLHSPKIRGEAWGLLVKVKEKVYLPKFPKQHFELFLYKTTPNCTPIGFSQDELAEWYFNAEIRVIAREAKFFASNLDNGNIRLEAWGMNRGEVAINYAHEELFSSANSIFDYQKYFEKALVYRRGNFQTLEDKIKLSKKDLFLMFDSFEKMRNFELRKDLLRLEGADSEAEKSRILKRLMHLPDGNPHRFVSEVARRYLKDEQAIKSILEMASYNHGMA